VANGVQPSHAEGNRTIRYALAREGGHTLNHARPERTNAWMSRVSELGNGQATRKKHSCASACKTSTTQNQPHQISNTQRTANKTDVVIQQHSRKLLLMDILMPETCSAHKKWNKIASDIKLVIHSSIIKMMHGPINIKLLLCLRGIQNTRTVNNVQCGLR